jgi:WD40 repeat protein
MLHSLKSKPFVTFISVFLLLIAVFLIFSSPAKTWRLPSSSEVIAFSPNGEMLATASGILKTHDVTPNYSIHGASSTVEIRRVLDGKIIQTIDFFSASSLAFSPDNSQIAIGGYGGEVEIHRISDGKLVRDLKINDLATDRLHLK